MKNNTHIILVLLAVYLCFTIPAFAQTCPPEDRGEPTAPPSTVHGVLHYHNQLRQWLGVEVNPQICGQTEFQLTFNNGDGATQARTMDGCSVTVTASLEYSPTGYYSANIYMHDAKIKPDKTCHPAPLLPDPPEAEIPSDLQSYKASVTINLEKNEPMRVRAWRTDQKYTDLTPSEAYINPLLTGGGDVLWVTCRDGFYSPDYMTIIKGHTEKVKLCDNSDMPGLVASEAGDSTIIVSCVQEKLSKPDDSCR